MRSRGERQVENGCFHNYKAFDSNLCTFTEVEKVSMSMHMKLSVKFSLGYSRDMLNLLVVWLAKMTFKFQARWQL